MRIVIIGGGITGLSAAHRIVELRSEKKLPVEVVLLEGGKRLGGVISTRKRDGFLIEEGPDSFITTKPRAIELSRRIGLDSEIIETRNENRRTFVLHRGKLIPLPEGFLMMAPTRFMPFLASPLFSWRGKLRMLMDLIIPPAQEPGDESLSSFVTRRLGREALERVAQPMVSGVYTADPERLSLRATMPRFLEMEERHGSLIRAILHEQRREKETSGARYGLFASFKNGMQTLVDALVARLPEDTVRFDQHVKRVEIKNGGWNVIVDKGERIHADGVIIAIPAHRAAALVEELDSSLATDLSSIEYASSAVINIAYREEDVSLSPEGFGFVVPIVENRPIIACSFSSFKFEGRAPKGFVLLRCFAGGAIQPEVYETGDPTLIETVEREIRELLDIKAKPLFSLLKRHPESMPQYRVGHLDLISQIREKVGRYSGLALAGNAYGGVGIPDCIHSGEESAEAVLKAIC